MPRMNWSSASIAVVDVGVLSCEAWVPIDICAIRVTYPQDGKPVATKFGARMRPDDPLDTVLWNIPEKTGYTTEQINAFPPMDDAHLSVLRRRMGVLFADAAAVVVYKEEYVRTALSALGLAIPERAVVVDMLPWMYFFRNSASAGWLRVEAHAEALKLQPTFSANSPNRSARHADYTWQLFEHYKSLLPSSLDAFIGQQQALAKTLNDWIAKLKERGHE